MFNSRLGRGCRPLHSSISNMIVLKLCWTQLILVLKNDISTFTCGGDFSFRPSRHLLHKYANEDVSLGSWFIGLDVEHIDDRRICCGTPPGKIYNYYYCCSTMFFLPWKHLHYKQSSLILGNIKYLMFEFIQAYRSCFMPLQLQNLYLCCKPRFNGVWL